MTALLKQVLPRRALLQAFAALPALSLFRHQMALPEEGRAAPTEGAEFVQRGGWILKRSDVA